MAQWLTRQLSTQAAGVRYPPGPSFPPFKLQKQIKNSNKYEIQNEFLNQFLYDIPDFIEV